jgi:hypothetical protein
MQILKYWDIQRWDGGERHSHFAFVESKEVANRWRAKHKHDVAESRRFLILESMEELEEYAGGALRMKALQKLSDAEKFVLKLI